MDKEVRQMDEAEDVGYEEMLDLYRKMSITDLSARWERILDRFDKEIQDAIITGQTSILLDFQKLDMIDPVMMELFIEKPYTVLYVLDKVIRDITEGEEHQIRSARIYNLPEWATVQIRDLRASHLGKIVCIKGLVRKATEVRPKIENAYFQCNKCGAVFSYPQKGQTLEEPYECPTDQGGCGRHTSFTLLTEDSVFVDSQKIEVQENPEGLFGGEQPQKISVYLEGDLVAKVFPGDEVTIIGIVNGKQRWTKGGKQSTEFGMVIDAHNIIPNIRAFEEVKILDEDIEKIKELSKDPQIHEKIRNSIAPTIYGMEKEKDALALQLFGGVPKVMPDGTKIRGDIHVLFVGEPGTGKSQLLKRVKDIAPRSVFTSGKGSSAVGLCVSPDTKILFGDGVWRKIGQFVEENIDGSGVMITDDMYRQNISDKNYTSLSIDEKGNVKKGKITHIWKIKSPEYWIELITKRTSIKVTPQTTLPIIENNKIIWKRADCIRPKDKIVAIDKTPQTSQTDVYPISYLPDHINVCGVSNIVKQLKYKASKKYGTIRNMAKAYGVSEDAFYYTWVREDKRGKIPLGMLRRLYDDTNSDIENLYKKKDIMFMQKNKSIFTIPPLVDKEFAYYLGILTGDGNICKSGGWNGLVIRFGNQDDTLINIFKDMTEKFFSIKPQFRLGNADRPQSYRYGCKTVGELLVSLGIPISPKSHIIEVPEWLFKQNNIVISYWLRGLFDTDGSMSNHSVDLYSSSKKLLEGVKLLLLRFGIKSLIRLKIKKGNISTKKNGIKIISNHNIYVLHIFGYHNILKYNNYIGFTCNSKKDKLEKYLSNVNKKFVKDESKYEIVTSVNKIKAESDYVYDITIEDNHNFLANELFVHNTASAVRDDFGEGRWTLEAGALVLADQGLAIVDELDKMRAQDRDALHEAMEQQEINIAKAGINATLKSRCSLLAAANPKFGRYDPYGVIADQINLPPPLISRFDLIFPIIDKINQERDRKLSSHILKSHRVGQILHYNEVRNDKISIDNEDMDLLTPEIDRVLLRKYIAYAKREVCPIMTEEAMKKLEDFYVDMRKQGIDSSSIPITARQIEGMIRMAEASAKIRLSNEVTEEDAQRAIDLLMYCLSKIGFDADTNTFDIDMVATGVKRSQADKMRIIKRIIEEGMEESEDELVSLEYIAEKAKEKLDMEFEEVEHLIEKMTTDGILCEPKYKHFQPT